MLRLHAQGNSASTDISPVLVASHTLTASFTGPQIVQVDFPTPVSILANTTYYLEFIGPAGDSGFFGGTTNLYSNGIAITNPNRSGFTEFQNLDFYFETLTDTSFVAVPEPCVGPIYAAFMTATLLRRRRNDVARKGNVKAASEDVNPHLTVRRRRASWRRRRPSRRKSQGIGQRVTKAKQICRGCHIRQGELRQMQVFRSADQNARRSRHDCRAGHNDTSRTQKGRWRSVHAGRKRCLQNSWRHADNKVQPGYRWHAKTQQADGSSRSNSLFEPEEHAKRDR